METNYALSGTEKTAGPKTDAIMAGLKNLAGNMKSQAKSYGSKVTGANVKAQKAAVDDAVKAKASLGKGGGKNSKKRVAAKHKALQTKIDRGPKNIAAAEKDTRKARIALGAGVAGAAGLAALARAVKRGGKSGVMSASKKQKLMAALKKHRKGIAIGGGAAVGTAGLAKLLKD